MNLIDIDKELQELAAARTRIQGSLKVIDEREALLGMIKQMVENPLSIHVIDLKALPHGNGTNPNDPQHALQTTQIGVNGGAKSLFAGCEKIADACEVIADITGGEVVLNHWAEHIREAGLSTAKQKKNIVSSMHSALSTRENEWRLVKRGVFRWIKKYP